MVDKPRKHGVFGTLWRVLAIGGVMVGVGALFGSSGEYVSATGKPTAPPSRKSLEAGHEVEDIHVGRTVQILIGMAATTALVVGIVFVMVWRFNVDHREVWSKLTSQQTANLIPPAPRVQRDPFADLAQVRAREERLLHSYGWTSADHSTARIPIDRAMTLVVGKSLDMAP